MLFGHSAPKSLRRNFLARTVAYQMEVEAYGGLSVETKRRLREIANALRNGDANSMLGSTRIRTGTQMIRQWQNTTHTASPIQCYGTSVSAGYFLVRRSSRQLANGRPLRAGPLSPPSGHPGAL